MKLVQNGTNREFQLVARPIAKFPKRNRFQVTVDGQATEVASTSNKAWAGTADFLEYIWIRDEEKGLVYFATLEYNELASNFVGAEFSIQDGAAAKPAARVTSRKEEATRIANFKKTWEDRYGKKAEPVQAEA